MPRQKTYYFIVKKSERDDLATRHGLRGVLDLMRYDGARVLSDDNTPGYYLFSAEHPPTVARWQTFDIHITRDHVDTSEGYLLDEARREAADAGDPRWAGFASRPRR